METLATGYANFVIGQIDYEEKRTGKRPLVCTSQETSPLRTLLGGKKNNASRGSAPHFVSQHGRNRCRKQPHVPVQVLPQ